VKSPINTIGVCVGGPKIHQQRFLKFLDKNGNIALVINKP